MTPSALILGSAAKDRIYPPSIRARLAPLATVVAEGTPADLPDLRDSLSDVSVLFSGWGAPRLTPETLSWFPELKLVLYGAGSLNTIVTDAFWERDIPICSAWVANAIPVAEFTFAQIILGLKQVHRIPGMVRDQRGWIRPDNFDTGGAFQTTVGLISLGQIGRFVAEFLRKLDVEVLACDPFCDSATAERLGVTLTSLEETFARSRVVSLHTPWLKETEGMITGDLLRRMPPGGTFINTARGAIVREEEMIEVLRERPDLTAVLDVTWPEPPSASSPLYDLPNVFLTPHIAGSMAGECGRMGSFMVDELERWRAGEPLKYRVTRDAFLKMA